MLEDLGRPGRQNGPRSLEAVGPSQKFDGLFLLLETFVSGRHSLARTLGV